MRYDNNKEILLLLLAFFQVCASATHAFLNDKLVSSILQKEKWKQDTCKYVRPCTRYPTTGNGSEIYDKRLELTVRTMTSL
jgi:hypothetical protein